MFTGIIEEIGKIAQVKRSGKSLILSIKTKSILEDTKLGDSISVDGVCLTVTSIKNSVFTADVMPETYKISTLKTLKPNTYVNLERAARVDSRLGGHIVTGHIDTIAIIKKIKQSENAKLFELQIQNQEYEVSIKDSISINGISLTVQDISNNTITVSIIPHTVLETTLQYKTVNSIVNIEYDTLKKQKRISNSITMKYLEANGFL